MPASMHVDSMPSTSAMPICRERIRSVRRQDDPPSCILANRTRLRVSRFLAAHLAVSDEIAFPIPAENAATGLKSTSLSTLCRSTIVTVIKGPSDTSPKPDRTSAVNSLSRRRFNGPVLAYPQYSFRVGFFVITFSLFRWQMLKLVVPLSTTSCAFPKTPHRPSSV